MNADLIVHLFQLGAFVHLLLAHKFILQLNADQAMVAQCEGDLLELVGDEIIWRQNVDFARDHGLWQRTGGPIVANGRCKDRRDVLGKSQDVEGNVVHAGHGGVLVDSRIRVVNGGAGHSGVRIEDGGIRAGRSGIRAVHGAVRIDDRIHEGGIRDDHRSVHGGFRGFRAADRAGEQKLLRRTGRIDERPTGDRVVGGAGSLILSGPFAAGLASSRANHRERLFDSQFLHFQVLQTFHLERSGIVVQTETVTVFEAVDETAVMEDRSSWKTRLELLVRSNHRLAIIDQALDLIKLFFASTSEEIEIVLEAPW